jgi:hypothetical protein
LSFEFEVWRLAFGVWRLELGVQGVVHSNV